MTDYYGQHGEDFILDQIFQGQEIGFFVEVGCIDGVRFSNTLTFERRGWKGLCIEAHGDYIEALQLNRPGSIVEHCAAAEADEELVSFYANFRGSLSSLDKTQEAKFKEYGKYFGGFAEQKVAKRRLDTVLAQHAIERIDILSLDIEGYEVNAMRGLDLSRYRPRVMVIEADDKAQEAVLDSLILRHGYVKWIRLGPNIFYLADSALALPVSDRLLQTKIIRAPDPFEGKDEHRIQVTIDTRVPFGGTAHFKWQAERRAPRLRAWLKGLMRRS